MKKTLTVNIGGSAFVLDEDAYNFLKSYLDDIKSRVANNVDYMEIMTDIERRVAEIFSAGIAANVQVVDVPVVRRAVDIIGQPYQFGPPPVGNSYAPAAKPMAKKLMRDPGRGVVGGVCAGIASFLDADLTMVRVLSVLLIIFAGYGLLCYIILWIVMPAASTPEEIEMVRRGYK